MELWHVLNRGVEKRDIFLDDRDRFRFVHGLALFNSWKAANNTTYLMEQDINDIVSRYKASGHLLVDIHGWCIMSNHYHLLISERMENGISLFIRKLNIGYAKYFNDRYDRSGYVFQGRTKKKCIDNDGYFLHILNYIHFNPLDLTDGCTEWRRGRISKKLAALDQLETYRWSSYLDYCGKDNFPSLLHKDLFNGVFGSVEKSTAKYLSSIEIDPELTLE